MATHRLMDMDRETESQTEAGSLESQLPKKRKFTILDFLKTYFGNLQVLDPNSPGFLGLIIKHSRFEWFRGWKVCCGQKLVIAI